MNRDKLKKIIEAALYAMSDPPAKTKHVEELVQQTGLPPREVETVIHDLKPKWEVRHNAHSG